MVRKPTTQIETRLPVKNVFIVLLHEDFARVLSGRVFRQRNFLSDRGFSYLQSIRCLPSIYCIKAGVFVCESTTVNHVALGMQRLKSLVCAGGVAFLSACASVPNEQHQAIELPTTTPFDVHPFARQVYLDAYKEGYQSAKRGGEITPRYERGPYAFARELGWRAGASAANNPEVVDPSGKE
jgi:hypothetical protein